MAGSSLRPAALAPIPRIRLDRCAHAGHWQWANLIKMMIEAGLDVGYIQSSTQLRVEAGFSEK